MSQYGINVLCVHYDNDQFHLCVIDKNMKKIIKTILQDDGTMFSFPVFLGVSADKNTIYVLDCDKGCYGITFEGQVVFHYQNPEAEAYSGLVVDSDGLFIGSDENKGQVEKLSFSGGRKKCVQSLVIHCH